MQQNFVPCNIGSLAFYEIFKKNAMKSVMAFPVVLGAVYAIVLMTGQLAVPMALITLAWGILGGIGANINQYWISAVAPEAPDFANGLFLTSANLGTTLGTTVCGFFISGMGIEFVVLGGMIFSVLSTVFIFMRVYMCSFKKTSFC